MDSTDFPQTCPACDGDFDYCTFQPGDSVIWNQQRKWGGTQPEPATFLEYRGQQSARIEHGGIQKTVTLARLRKSETNNKA